MNEFKGTPGPWRTSSAYGTCVIDSSGRTLLSLVTNYVERNNVYADIADARLIAAAPEMLEALRQATQSMLDSGYSPNSVVIQANNAAIAKALGETE